MMVQYHFLVLLCAVVQPSGGIEMYPHLSPACFRKARQN
jgi:hypothetical protein